MVAPAQCIFAPAPIRPLRTTYLFTALPSLSHRGDQRRHVSFPRHLAPASMATVLLALFEHLFCADASCALFYRSLCDFDACERDMAILRAHTPFRSAPLPAARADLLQQHDTEHDLPATTRLLDEPRAYDLTTCASRRPRCRTLSTLSTLTKLAPRAPQIQRASGAAVLRRARRLR
ncbi:hypothetical protein C8F04DRAFT_180915 [Mycena alexandri]|uniref:Uncharacterized protein n=1 Tax=Mycena alexandri TaxID=1745969 RepID=A0AAD6WSN4_9AGAR|nr:hypothetical protein C8F04DRAFT_180915 [Mycena alexandri]